MDVFGAIVGTFGFLIMIGAIVGLILPVKAWRAQRRGLGITAISGLAAFIFGMVITPTPPSASEATAQTATNVAPAVVSAEDPAVVKQKVTAQATTVWESILDLAKPCEAAGRKLASVSGSRNLYTMFEAAKAGEATCGEAASQTDALEPPAALNSDGRSAFKNGIAKCAQGHRVRQRAYARFAEVLDGDMKPSSVAEAKEYMETAAASGIFCAAGMFDAASKAGVETKIFNAKT